MPLGIALSQQLDQGRAQPIAYPVTRSLYRRLHERVDQDADVRIMLLGRSSVRDAVGIWLATPGEITKAYRDELRAIVRDEMQNPDLEVHVVAIRSAMED